MFAHFFLFPVKTTPPLSALCMDTEGAEQQEGFSALLRVGPGTPPHTHTHTFPPPPAQHPGRLPSALQSQGQCSGAASAWPSTGSEDGKMPWHCSLAPSFSPRGFIIIIFLFWSSKTIHHPQATQSSSTKVAALLPHCLPPLPREA